MSTDQMIRRTIVTRRNQCPDQATFGHRNCPVCTAYAAACQARPVRGQSNPCPDKNMRSHTGCSVCTSYAHLPAFAR